MILFDVTVTAAEGKREALRQLFAETMAGSNAEPGCLIYRFTADLDDPDRYYLIELWEDEAAFQGHVRGAAFRRFIAEIPALGTVVSSAARAGPLEPYSYGRQPQ